MRNLQNFSDFLNRKSSSARLGICYMTFMLMALLAFYACNKESIEPVGSTIILPTDQESQKMKDFLVSGYGFSTNNIQEIADGFIVEGDVLFPKTDFWENFYIDTISRDRLKKHYRYSNLVTAITTINVAIDPAVPSAWQTAFKSAFTKWNGLNGKIKLQLVTDYCPAYGINILYSPLGKNNTIAQATWPNSKGYPGLFVNVNSQLKTSLTSSQKLFAAVHELGHCIGLRHTDISDGFPQILTSITACNTGSDLSSVMRSVVNTFSDFSTCDKAAFKVLYPK